MAIVIGVDGAWSAAVTTAASVTPTFSPAAQSLVILEFQHDYNAADADGTFTPSNSGTPLTWNAIGAKQAGVSGNGQVMAWWAWNDTAQTNITATVTVSVGLTTRNKTVKVTTWTGTSITGAVVSKTAGSSSTNDTVVTVTTSNKNSRIMGTALDFLALGLPTSTDDENAYNHAGDSGMSVRKSANTGTSGTSVTLDFDAAGTGTPNWSYKVWEIIPAAKGTAAFAVTAAVSATGRIIKKGTAALSLNLGLAATGDSPGWQGQGALKVNVTVAATGFAPVVIVPVRVFTPREILTGNRNTRFYLDILDANDAPLARLDGVTDGKLDWVANAMIKGGGTLTVVDVNQTINWLTARIKPVMLVEGLPPQPLGVYLPSEAPESWASGRSWAVKLLDKTTILDQDTVVETYSLPAGTVATTAVVSLITSAGISNHAVTPSVKVLDGDLVWSPGTGKLRIINDILDAINYFSLYSNFDGQMVAEPYVVPAQRPLMYEFYDGPDSIYEPAFGRDIDIWSIPNRVTLIGVGGGTTAALTSTANNNDPRSPYSIANRGRVIGRTETGVEAADQSVLDSIARTRLIELTSPTAGVEISHAPVPGLAINQATAFRRHIAGIDGRHVVSKTAITLKGTALAVSTLREVVDI